MAWTANKREKRVQEVTLTIYSAMIGACRATGGGKQGWPTYDEAKNIAIDYVANEERDYP